MCNRKTSLLLLSSIVFFLKINATYCSVYSPSIVELDCLREPGSEVGSDPWGSGPVFCQGLHDEAHLK